MTWWAWLLLAIATIVLLAVCDLVFCRGKRCAQLVEYFILDPKLRAARRARHAAPRRPAPPRESQRDTRQR
jgi:hypothetical protein